VRQAAALTRRWSLAARFSTLRGELEIVFWTSEAVTDERAGRRLARAIQGRGAFRRFNDELHEEHPDLLPAWYAFRAARARRHAVQWLAGNSLIDEEAAGRFLAGHPDPDLP
jgi:Uncharacterised protein family (UPF0158)